MMVGSGIRTGDDISTLMLEVPQRRGAGFTGLAPRGGQEQYMQAAHYPANLATAQPVNKYVNCCEKSKEKVGHSLYSNDFLKLLAIRGPR
jgi:hypothetical protein